MERRPTLTKFQEDYVNPTQETTLQIQRSMSSSLYTLNNALTKAMKGALETEREIMLE